MAKLNFDNFVSTHNGKSYDVDGAFGAQCWDGYAEYCRWLGIGYNHVGNVGAKGLWDQTQPGCKRITEWQKLQKGDIIIWDGTLGGGFGHVAMFDHWGGSNAVVFGQNQGASANLQTGGPFCFITVSSAGFRGAFRPDNIMGGVPLWTVDVRKGIVISIAPQN